MTETLEQIAETPAPLEAAVPQRLTPLQPGRDKLPAVTAGGKEISIIIASAGQAPIRIVIRTPGAEASAAPAASAPQAPPQAETHASLAPAAEMAVPAAVNITKTHMAGIGVTPAAFFSDSMTPSSVVALNNLFQTRSEQINKAESMFAFHEKIKPAMEEAFSAHMQSINPEIFEQATRLVHQVMADLLSGNIIMDVAPDKIMEIRDHVIDHILLEVKNQGKAGTFNADSMKQSVLNSGPVLKFKETHHTSHKHSSNVHYHPASADKKATEQAADSSRLKHHGKVMEAAHGHAAEVAVE